MAITRDGFVFELMFMFACSGRAFLVRLLDFGRRRVSSPLGKLKVVEREGQNKNKAEREPEHANKSHPLHVFIQTHTHSHTFTSTKCPFCFVFFFLTRVRHKVSVVVDYICTSSENVTAAKSESPNGAVTVRVYMSSNWRHGAS